MSYKDRLMSEIENRGIVLEPERKYRNVDLEMVLSDHILKETPELKTWGITRRLELESPMLCYSFKDLKPEEREEIVKSPRWVAEQKMDGVRCLVSYHPQEGFEFYSRDVSVDTWLPVSYTPKLLLQKDGVFRRPDEFKGSIPFNFVIDCELIADNKNLDTSLYGGSGVRTFTELNATVAIMGSDPERAHSIQREQGGLSFFAFDIIHLGSKDLRDLPLEQRRVYLEKVIKTIEPITPFQIVAQERDNKKAYYDKITEEGKEGVVLKNLDEKYYSVDARKRKVQVKWKRSMTEALEKAGMAPDIDVFISGFVPPLKNSSLQHLIGGVKVSVYLTDEETGEMYEHWVGVVSGIPHGLKNEMTILDQDGKPTLNPSFKDRVITVDAQDISSKSLRFSHCRAVDSCGNKDKWIFRDEKPKYSCKLSKKFLLSQIL